MKKIDMTKFPKRDEHEPYYIALVEINRVMDEIDDVLKPKINELIDKKESIEKI